MKTFLKLVRWPNLLIAAFTMILMRYAVIEPVISKITVSLSGNPDELVPLSLKLPWGPLPDTDHCNCQHYGRRICD